MRLADWKNKLYFGDKLYILRELVQDETVDLIYPAPPFKNRTSPLIKSKTQREVGGQLCQD